MKSELPHTETSMIDIWHCEHFNRIRKFGVGTVSFNSWKNVQMKSFEIFGFSNRFWALEVLASYWIELTDKFICLHRFCLNRETYRLLTLLLPSMKKITFKTQYNSMREECCVWKSVRTSNSKLGKIPISCLKNALIYAKSYRFVDIFCIPSNQMQSM